MSNSLAKLTKSPPRWLKWLREFLCRHEWRYIEKKRLFGLQMGYVNVPKALQWRSDQICSKCAKVEFNATKIANAIAVAKIEKPVNIDDLT